MIIGVSAYAQAGKDSLAGFLIEDFGFHRFAFADALRGAVYALNPIAEEVRTTGHDTRGSYRDVSTRTVQDIVDAEGWERAKLDHPEIRRLLQAMGTEAGRKILGENIWVDIVFRQAEEAGVENAIITDCRFPNEAQAVKNKGGFVVRVTRPGVQPVNAHPSEVALDDWGFDYAVHNDGTLDELHLKAKDLYEHLLEFERDTDRLPTKRLPGYGSPTAKAK